MPPLDTPAATWPRASMAQAPTVSWGALSIVTSDSTGGTSEVTDEVRVESVAAGIEGVSVGEAGGSTEAATSELVSLSMYFW